MTGPTFSPDGQWMWDGNAWIPAPPQANVLPQTSLNQNQISTVANNAGVPVNQLSNTAPYFDQNRDRILQNTELQQAAAAIAQPPTMPVPMQSPQPPVMQQPMVQQPMVQQPMMQQPILHQKKESFVVPWIGVGMIFMGLLLPFVSFLFIEFTGFEMITEISEWFGDVEGADSDGGDSSSGDDTTADDTDDIDMKGIMLVIAALLFGFSPFFYIISAVISMIVLLKKKSPNYMGQMHLTYAGLFFLCAIISSSDSLVSFFDFIGIGFYLASFAGVLLIIRN
jgi:hypothetical protein